MPRDGAGAPLFYREPLHIVRGEGAYLFDAAGRRYVDMYNSVPCVGHAHPLIVEAMAAQQATLNVHSRHLHEGILELAERITELHGERLESVVFLCTGTEANEMALRMARAATGWRGIVCSGAAYHGTSAVVGKLTHVHPRTPERGTEVRGFPFPQTHRPLAGGPIDEPIEELRARYLDRLPAAIDDLTNDGVGFAGSVCPIFASEGLPTVPDGFMPRAAAIARGWGSRHLRRGAGRLLPHRSLVGLRGCGIRARHRGDGQADGGRAAPRRNDREPRSRGDVPQDRLLQYVRVEPAAGRRRQGGHRHHRRRGSSARGHVATGLTTLSAAGSLGGNVRLLGVRNRHLCLGDEYGRVTA